MPILDTNKFKVESKAHELWRKTKEGCGRAVNYVMENKEGLVMVATAVAGIVGAGTKISSAISRRRNIREERDLKDYRVYDRRCGAYLHLRKPLKNSDWKKINEKLAKGERLADVLQRMDMLK